MVEDESGGEARYTSLRAEPSREARLMGIRGARGHRAMNSRESIGRAVGSLARHGAGGRAAMAPKSSVCPDTNGSN